MIPSEESLIAYVDGELSGEEAANVEATLRDRADLREFVERQRALRSMIGNALSHALELPVPSRLKDAVAHSPVSWRWRLANALLAIRGRASQYFTPYFVVPAGAALAFGLIVGIAVDRGYVARNSIIVAQENGILVAKGALADALTHRLSSEGTSASGVKVAVSFRSRDGHDCRTFSGSGQWGIACRSANGWSIAMLVAAPEEGNRSIYQMAGSAMPDSIRKAISGMIVGEPFDAAAERNARARNWVAR